MRHITTYTLFESVRGDAAALRAEAINQARKEYDHHRYIIKDIFQDMIDDYDIIEFDPHSPDQDLDILLYYFEKYDDHTQKNTNLLSFEIFPLLSKTSKNYIVKDIDFSGHASRLESMGYELIFEWVGQGHKPFDPEETQDNARFVRIIIDYTNA